MLARLRSLISMVLGRSAEVGAALSYELVLLASLTVIYPVTVRELGPEGYGQYTTLYVIAGLAMTWVHSGCAAAIVQLILQRGRRTGLVLRRALRQIVALAVPGCILGLGAAVLLLGIDLWIAALVILAVDLLVGGVAAAQVSVVFAVRGAGPASIIRSVNPLVRLTGVVGLALTGNVTLINLVAVNALASLVVLAVAYRWSRAVVADGADDGTEPGANELRGLSLMYSASMSTNAVQEEADKLTLAHFRPIAEVGEYQAAYRIVSIGFLPLRAMESVAMRWFLRADTRVGTHLRKAWLLSIPVFAYGLVIIAGLVATQPIIAWIIGPEFQEATTITLWLAAAPLLYGLAEVPMLGLLGLGENRIRMFVGFVTATLALALFIGLVPWLGWRGAVIGIYVSEVVTIALGWLVLYRLQRRHDATDRAGTSLHPG